MTYKYIFDPIAITEYEEAITWYGEHSHKAMDDFILEVRRKINFISSAPENYKNTYKKYRETALNRFPYSIVYVLKENVIIITSIYHHKRNSKRKYKK